MEKVTTCFVCEDENMCFEEIQGDTSSYMCFCCGFMSDSRFTKDNEGKVRQDSSILINKLKTFDSERGIYWYPSVVNMGKLGIIYPEGDESNWKWKYAKTIEIPEDKRAAFGNHSMRLDTENAEEFESTDFLSACKSMGIAKDIYKQ